MDVVVGVGAIDGGGKLVAQVGGDGVVLGARVRVIVPTPLRVSVRSVFMRIAYSRGGRGKGMGPLN